MIFWFYLFGAPAALAYRLLALHGDLDFDETDADQPGLKWLWLMEWLPVRLLGLTVGLVGNFFLCRQCGQEIIILPQHRHG